MRAVKIASLAIAFVLFAFTMSAQADDLQPPTLPSACDPRLQVPDGNALKFHAFATGFQNYHWSGSTWLFDGPTATLFADPGHHGQVGIHYVGPTWQSNSGSIVKAGAVANCKPDTTAIPSLLLTPTLSYPPP